MTVATEDENENCYLKKVEIWNVSLVSKLVPQQKRYQELFGIIRRDCVKYHNHGNTVLKFTLGTIVRLFNLGINYFVKDLAKVEELINVIQRVDDDINRDATPAECDCCCDGHCNLTHLPRVKMEDFDPFSTLMAADVIPHDYPEAEDDEFVGDLPLPGEKDALYAVLTALEMKFDLDVCQEDTDTSLSH